MAIYIGLSLIDEVDGVRRYRMERSDGTPYGVLGVDLRSMEFQLLESASEGCEHFAFPRACRAIVKAAERGDVPAQLSYSA